MKKLTNRDLMLKILDALWILNQDNRMKKIEWDNDLLKGNRDESDKRFRLLLDYLGIEYHEKRGYKKHIKNKI